MSSFRNSADGLVHTRVNQTVTGKPEKRHYSSDCEPVEMCLACTRKKCNGSCRAVKEEMHRRYVAGKAVLS